MIYMLTVYQPYVDSLTHVLIKSIAQNKACAFKMFLNSLGNIFASWEGINTVYTGHSSIYKSSCT